MAYSEVNVPRFIVDYLSWYNALGLINLETSSIGNGGNPLGDLNIIKSFLGLNPSSYIPMIRSQDVYSGLNFQLKTPNGFPISMVNVVGVFNHNLADYYGQVVEGNDFRIEFYWNETAGGGALKSTNDIDINFKRVQGATTALAPDYNGWSLRSVSGSTGAAQQIDNTVSQLLPNIRGINKEDDEINIGSLLMGRYHDMVNAPNLSLTMRRDYGGTKEFTTYNGSSMSNTMYTGNPKWGNLGAWELSPATISQPQNLSRSGRRFWQLKFSFMGDSDLWGSNQMISKYLESDTGYEEGDISDDGSAFNYNLLTDDDSGNFFSRVWQPTLGGSLPMIMQMDKNNSNPDGFAIVKIKGNSLKAVETAPHLYDISLDIEELF